MKRTVDTPTGAVTLTEENSAIVAVEWGGRFGDTSDVLCDAERQIEAYFAGELREFGLPLKVRGSQFQQDVCAVMAAIPFGDTLTYGDIAKRLGAPAQAVGQACGGNPIPLIIPCHRVLGASGLGGFSGGVGVETKVWLLKHEGAAGLLI
ncbi:methylated-DNA--[protein]-cysteine S-methyltransferase [Lentibacter sp. XHP0401]|jgi:methylated-DNA-[protein]-cysteine S-methyltransferase|uniref:methylated-DNA--[protein]-cysteine S-methyltransferase n=1 Tax=Lentibacter sp. XHP0401 TaxID=2984334 RepID=UPI0021E951AB|nr:methylated-DNA--[protein]-cysteine S-methyltransferase [Lentibacter sp. XHP0401]MCV2894161.1 methylated-DNA--[protein]-cysteine S-methyltransferase [Lentibacter sp. XHP0401]